MIGHEFPLTHAEEALRVIRALGAHRYVAGRAHMVHAFAVVAAGSDPAAGETLDDARQWALGVLNDDVLDEEAVDANSRDPALLRKLTDAELLAVLRAFWVPGPARGAVHAALEALLSRIDRPACSRVPFDETSEEEVFPVLVDAGWELLKLAELDAERHKGVIASFDDFEVACFEESSDGVDAYLHELPVLGADELLRGVDAEGAFLQPFAVFTDAPEPYDDYLLRGVERAAKLTREEQ